MTTDHATTTPRTVTAPAVHRVDVPGGQLHVEVRGAGPLLLVVGQPMTSEPFAPLADALAADRTVVTYDPRGLGRSTVADPTLPVTPERQADDLARVVEVLGGGPADVLGSSGGAVTALALAARHPGLVGVVVAHEPPVTELLPDAAWVRAVVDGIEDAYRRDGAAAAWGLFVALVMHDGPVPADGVSPVAWPPPGAGPEVDPAAPGGATSGDAPDDGSAAPRGQEGEDRMFFLRMLKPFTRWVPPTDALRGPRPRVVVAVGEDSAQQVAARSARALADALGTAPAVFPGDHGGFMPDPVGFADAVRREVARMR
ncbi:alpha/beta hydrolase [Cellulomonas sp. ATA003]|uniref:alpha/beta fold hydrolase n=1 Tax=Cellulomonas sp. ATA003 TaxID=3073064 RepID=UPI0028730EFD|nr:alpha/beta hydrolase [Cellulomonas sp. ATA003]WNB86236.1 alpha/beta hydrolase [Cellulomonas sp. ATA003]